MNSSHFTLFPKEWKDANSSYLLLILLFLCIMIASVLASFSMLLAHQIWGFSIKELPQLSNRISEHNVLRCMQMLQLFSSIGLFLIPPIFFIYITRLRFFNIRVFPSLIVSISGILLMWSFLPLINFSAEVNTALQLPAYFDSVMQWIHDKEDAANIVANGFLKMDGFTDLGLSLFIIAIIPAIGEELLFRGTIQPILQKLFNNPHLSIWGTAFIFSFIHFQFLGFLPRFLIGGFLGYLFYWSGSIWLPIIVHFVNNATAVIIYYLYQHNLIQHTTDELGIGEYKSIELIVSIILVVLGLKFIFSKTFINQTSQKISK
jgi:membrane protease YdiL (CAAX protease family)